MSSNYSQGWFWGNAVGKSEASPKCTQRIVLSLKVILISFLAWMFCARDLNLEPSAAA